MDEAVVSHVARGQARTVYEGRRGDQTVRWPQSARGPVPQHEPDRAARNGLRDRMSFGKRLSEEPLDDALLPSIARPLEQFQKHNMRATAQADRHAVEKIPRLLTAAEKVDQDVRVEEDGCRPDRSLLSQPLGDFKAGWFFQSPKAGEISSFDPSPGLSIGTRTALGLPRFSTKMRSPLETRSRISDVLYRRSLADMAMREVYTSCYLLSTRSVIGGQSLTVDPRGERGGV